MLSADYIVPPSSGEAPKSLVLLLHGVGANGEDLLPLATHWAGLLPDALFISPNALQPYDGGFPGAYQWFSLDDITPENREQRVREAAPLLNEFIDSQLATYGLDDSRLILVGFSQGTIMSLFVALRRMQPCAGLLGYSGRLAGAAALSQELVSRPRTLLIHGTADSVIPLSELHLADRALGAAGVPVRAVPMLGVGHTISYEGEMLGGQFLQYCLSVPHALGLDAFNPQAARS